MKPLSWLFRKVWLPVAYYLCWVSFGGGGLLLNLLFAPLLLAPRRQRFTARSRAITRAMLRGWSCWLHYSRVIPIKWVGFDRPLPHGTIYIANHPGLLDAPILLSRLPDTLCIFKPALARNPCTGPTALMCGYIPGDQGVDLIREVAAQIKDGKSLLIFPEGTRTNPGNVINPLKPGFALIANRAHAPIQIIRIRSGPCLARKGHPWLVPPPMPCWIEFTLDEFIPADAACSPIELTACIEARLRAILPPWDYS